MPPTATATLFQLEVPLNFQSQQSTAPSQHRCFWLHV